ncbi:MAG: DNA recombination protein RmuC [Gaiellales bacterium]
MQTVFLLIGLLVGGGAVLLAVRSRLHEPARLRLTLEREAAAHAATTQRLSTAERQLAATTARLEATEASFDTRVTEAIRAASADAYRQTNASFLELAGTKLGETVAPLRQSLDRVNQQVQELDRARAQSYGALTRQLSELGERTQSLTTALRTPHVRGRWGEIQLKRVMELAGMLPHCDFDEQVSTTTDAGRLRPDAIVRLPGGKQVVVDAKVPLAAYLDAIEATDVAEREARLADHARHVRDHVQKLAEKQYWAQFADSPEMVVMFLPDEGFFRAAWEHDRELVEIAVRSRVHIASPTTLIVLLQAIAHGWQQEKIAEDAREVHALGRELYERLTVAGGHLGKVGGFLDKAVGSYNEAVGSLERRVLPTARKLGEASLSEKELDVLEPVSRTAAALRAPELAPPKSPVPLEQGRLEVIPPDTDANAA